MSESYNEGPPNPEIRPLEPMLQAVPQYWEPGTFFAVTPSDTAVLAKVRALWIGGAGAVAVRGLSINSAPVTLAAAPAGTKIEGRFSQVMATNTTATLIVAFCD